MKNKFLKGLLASFALAASGIVNAGVMPYGIQTDLTQTIIEGWGWTECSRSSSTQNIAYSTVESSCTGDLMMMTAWDASLGLYGIAAAGEKFIMTTNTFVDYGDDENYSVLDNWNNGVNFYRTAGIGSWGFTSIDSVALNSADINLVNGLSDYSSSGTSTSELALGTAAIGLSWHSNGGSLTSGWTYNATGYNNQSLYDGDQRVFFTMNSSDIVDVPEPSALAFLAIALMGLASRKFKKKS